MNADILSTFSKILVFTAVYVFGRLNFSIGCLVPLFYVAVQDHFLIQRRIRKAATHAALGLSERDTLVQRLDDIPTWVIFPDYERVEWLNKILKKMWPHVDKIVVEKMLELEPVLQQNPMLQSLIFGKISLGKLAPQITGVKVYDQAQVNSDELVIDVNISYFGDAQVNFSLNNLEGGIKDIEIEGQLRVIFKPLKPELPMFTAIQFYLLKQPILNFEFTGALNFGSPVLHFIRDMIKSSISNYVVYPNKISYELVPGANVDPFEMPQIDGIIRVTISYSTIENYSDLFLTVDLGQTSLEFSKREMKRLNKEEDFEMVCDLISYTKGDDHVHITLKKRADDSVVGTMPFSLQAIKDSGYIGGKRMPFKPQEAVSYDILWLPITKQGTQDFCVLQVFIDIARNISEKYCPYVEIGIDTVFMRTPTSKVQDETAVWNKYFNFFLKSAENQVLRILLVDKLTKQTLGSITYEMNILLKRKGNHVFQAYPLERSHNIEVVMALRLNFIKGDYYVKPVDDAVLEESDSQMD